MGVGNGVDLGVAVGVGRVVGSGVVVLGTGCTVGVGLDVGDGEVEWGEGVGDVQATSAHTRARRAGTSHFILLPLYSICRSLPDIETLGEKITNGGWESHTLP